MLMSIGELADRTGVSRRMLRHWDDLGLLEPAQVDPVTGYRRYAASQSGRVHAITTLRGWGFGLDEVGRLLEGDLTAERLLDLLRSGEQDLVDQVRTARASLTAVRRRIRSIERGVAMSATSLALQSLPALQIRGLRVEVGDETGIGHAVSELSAAVRAVLPDAGLVRTYHGRPDGGNIEVTVGVVDGPPDDRWEVFEVSACEHGVTIDLGPDPGDIGDAWVGLDAALLRHGLTTTGTYRHLTSGDGEPCVTLQAPVVSLGPDPD
ncbi:MAG TPA: MerR family DNA-binding transcriptional regulator [Candidatus Avipropionibacterium avicola]|uniref:MerR family DNA-binding transcriptional regulator n=1 Tax=Candidatus Avipropionibacterium avicola TaxID=2840701 RepID=A0A9D1KMQ0_9ACTN|nr:MerR family DNA-binding transcriptional regulator [Candidatus Avipropionibacterium avicola]